LGNETHESRQARAKARREYLSRQPVRAARAWFDGGLTPLHQSIRWHHGAKERDYFPSAQF
jgi:hypothetical protein